MGLFRGGSSANPPRIRPGPRRTAAELIYSAESAADSASEIFIPPKKFFVGFRLGGDRTHSDFLGLSRTQSESAAELFRQLYYPLLGRQSPLLGGQSPPLIKSAADKVRQRPPGEKYPGKIIGGLCPRRIKSAADFFLNPNPNPNPGLGLGLGLGLRLLTLTLTLTLTANPNPGLGLGLGLRKKSAADFFPNPNPNPNPGLGLAVRVRVRVSNLNPNPNPNPNPGLGLGLGLRKKSAADFFRRKKIGGLCSPRTKSALFF